MFKLFDGFGCHLAGALVESNGTLGYMGSLTFMGRIDLQSNPQPKNAVQPNPQFSFAVQ